MAPPTPNLTVHHLQVGQGERIPFLLEELSIPYNLVLHERSPLLSPPALKAKSPLGASPLLEDYTFNPSKPLVLAESGAIVEYIIHKHGNGRLALPPSHDNYADYLYWFHFANSTLQPGLFRRALSRALLGTEDDRRYVGTDARVKAAIGSLDQRLKENTWLAGEEFTAADVMSVWCFTTMRMFEPLDLTGYEGILSWLARVAERPAYRTAMRKGDPDLKIEELISAKGPKEFLGGAFAKAYQAPK